MQKGLVNELKDFDKKCHEIFEDEIDIKKYKFNELEYNVFKIKSNTEEYEKSLFEIKEKKMNLEEIIRNIKKKNLKIKEIIFAIRIKYLKTRTKLLKIYSSLNVKSLDDIIKRFKDERLKYQGYNSMVIFY